MDEFRRQHINDRLSERQGFDHLSQTQLVQVIGHCSANCKEMITYLIDREELAQRRRQLKLLRDCESICDFTSSQLAKGSFLSPSLLKLCGYTCEHCGRECSQFSDPMSSRCAQICSSCAKYCQTGTNEGA